MKCSEWFIDSMWQIYYNFDCNDDFSLTYLFVISIIYSLSEMQGTHNGFITK